MSSVAYDPSVFDVGSLKQAKTIILTHEGIGTDVRWEKETQWLTPRIIDKLKLTASSRVLDYGCGVGRMSKALIDEVGCSVYGYDTSEAMIALSRGYVGSPRFKSVNTIPIVDAAIAIWVLQHCYDPEEDIEMIHSVLPTGGKFFILNNVIRALPIMARQGRAWGSDGLDILQLLSDKFKLLEKGQLPASMAPKPGPEMTYWAVLEAR